jgi:hypothetical protein
VTVQSEKTTATLVDKHMIEGKLVPAKGEKLSGYGVEVFNGTTQVGEFYSSPELKLKASGSAAQ